MQTAHFQGHGHFMLVPSIKSLNDRREAEAPGTHGIADIDQFRFHAPFLANNAGRISSYRPKLVLDLGHVATLFSIATAGLGLS
jgi:hypothetical protein